jgi:hypothetical protein
MTVREEARRIAVDYARQHEHEEARFFGVPIRELCLSEEELIGLLGWQQSMLIEEWEVKTE